MHRLSLVPAYAGLAVSVGLAVSLLAGAATTPPAPPPPGYATLPALAPEQSAAGETWSAMRETSPASVIRLDGGKAFRMPCNFQGVTDERASWDWRVALDLSGAQGLQFQFYCADPTPVSGFTFYLRSGNGWYSTSFAPCTPGQWETVLLEKTATTHEGTPAGWTHISGIRVSAWRGAAVDTEFYMANFGRLGGRGAIAVIRGEQAMISLPDAAQAVRDASQLVCRHLSDLGLGFWPVSDLDLTAGSLDEVKLAILPYNPALPAGAEEVLKAFLAGGGKIIAFYHLPRALAPLLGMEEGKYRPQAYPGQFAGIRRSGAGLYGMPEQTSQRSWNICEMRADTDKRTMAAEWYDEKGQPTGCAAVLASRNCLYMSHILLRDDPQHKRMLLLSMLGHFLPECWEQAAQTHLEWAGAIGPYRSFAEAEAAIRRDAQAPEAAATLDKALDLMTKANEALRRQAFSEALALGSEARQRTIDAYCAAQRPREGEHRAFWCHDAFGVASMSWNEAVATLARNGFTAILPNMLWGGVAYYDSEVLPVAPEVKERGDQIAACLAACRKYGLECHVWKVNWNMGGRAPQSFAKQMKEEQRTQVCVDGTPRDTWLCPSHPENQQLEIQSMLEVAAKYEVDGLHFDYIRYPDSQSCYCAGCRARFEKEIGKTIENWPGAVLEEGSLRELWLEFRRAQITRVVAAVHEGTHKIRPDIAISAAVFSAWPKNRDTIAQDWKLWCDKGYLDFVCPMDYTPHNVQFASLVEQQRAWAGKVPCYPGIGLSLWPDEDPILRLIDQIGLTRRLNTGGFTIFNYGLLEAGDSVPRCGMGITRRSKAVP